MFDRSRHIMPLPASEVRDKLDRVLSDEQALIRSANATFKQFDKDGSGALSVDEVAALLRKLCFNLQLPPIDFDTLQRIVSRYDTEDEDELNPMLNLNEFLRLYRDILQLIQEKYYPKRTLIVRRSFFIGRHKLCDKSSIESLYTFDKKLGAGSFGLVHLVTERATNLRRVIKTINKQQVALPIEQVNGEIEILKSLDHPNIIKIFDVFEDLNNVYIVQEYCEGGELMRRITSSGGLHTEKFVAQVMRYLLEAVIYCHEKKIAHKDLKPENIMFVSNKSSQIKVIDFGVAELFNKMDSTSRRAAGTALYMAPEVFQLRVGLKCDVWSAGCVMYLMLTGKLPFMGRTLHELQQKVNNSEPNFTRDCAGLSPDAIEVVKSMLIKNPSIRPSARRILTHPWFQNASGQREYLTPEISQNLQRYMRQSNLRNALVNMMVHQLSVTAPQVQKLGNLFRSLDKDNNGVLTISELSEGLKAAGWKPWDVNRIASALDMDGSGNVDYTEFLAACFCWRETEMNVVWAAFNKLDTDGDGKITTTEFAQVLLGERGEEGATHLMNETELDEMLRQIDRNGDGYVEWWEFLRYIKGEMLE